MIKKIYLLTLFSFFYVSAAHAQAGLKGKVLDKGNNEPIPFANVVVELNGSQVAGGTTDFDGNYFIKPLAPGKYDVKATYVGYQPVVVGGVIIKGEQIQFLDIRMSQGIELKAFEKVEYTVPLIDKDNTASGGTVTREDIAKMPGRSAESVAITVGGIYSQDGERGSVRGSRDNATDTYIDGVKVRGSSNIPNSAIEQVSVIVGGLPAQYGDATGGVISITTRGPSAEYFGGVEVVTSQLTDKFGYNLIGANVSGPLLSRPDPLDSTRKKPLLGFFLSAEANYQKDPRPSAIGSLKGSDSILTYLQENPLRVGPSGIGSLKNAEFVHASDIERIDARQNVESKGVVAQGKVDLAASSTTNLTFGGTFDLATRRADAYGEGVGTTVYRNTLFNSENNPIYTDNTWRIYSRFTQRLSSGDNQDESASNIKNAYYSLQLDYSKFNRTLEDKTHRDNFFDYGYIGKFTSTFVPFYLFGEDSTGRVGYIHESFDQIAYDFEPGDKNPILAKFTDNYYNLYETVEGHYQSPLEVETGGGLLNGTRPGMAHSLWTLPGVPYNRYEKREEGMFRIRATGSADIKHHALLLGFEYEQRQDRRWVLDPAGLWTRMRNLANNHIPELDRMNPIIEQVGTYERFTYNRLNSDPGEYNGEGSQSFLDYNVRKALGLDPDGVDYIQTDSLPPDFYSLDFFSAEELLNEGNADRPLQTYYGYDHTGKKIKGRRTLEDFLTKKDDFGNFTREMGAFEPIYMSFYMQDKFAFEDLIFNVGMRIDRYDANQKVLKDKYSLFETVKAGEVDYSSAKTPRPANIGDDFVVYVDDVKSPNAEIIKGYRDGDTWYDAEGKDISLNPQLMRTSTGQAAPWLVNPEASNPRTDLSSNSFKDYEPQVVFMPRIAFSFPISDEALFFAHYDILAQRPNYAQRFNPSDYLFSKDDRISNPDLKPQKTIDYELGFQQKLSNSSSLKLAAFYREMRDLIQVVNTVSAFPKEYTTFGNQDFGTVKGSTITYDLRRTGNVSLRASYTLTFAQGTGSSEETGLNLVNAGYSNLRTIFPLDIDQRHQIVTVFDYRYGSGKDYNGPILFNKQILANTGLNVLFQGGSGAPFTAQKDIKIMGEDGGQSGLVKGGINGARLPWQFRTDLRLDRDFKLKYGNAEAEEARKALDLNVYVIVLNALDAKNIIRVYRATGNPDDDGYLAAAQYQAQIEQRVDPISYRELYALKINNPYNYSLPRRIRLGVILNF